MIRLGSYRSAVLLLFLVLMVGTVFAVIANNFKLYKSIVLNLSGEFVEEVKEQMEELSLQISAMKGDVGTMKSNVVDMDRQVGVVNASDAEEKRLAYRLSLDDAHCSQEHDCEEQLRWISQEGKREVVYLVDIHSSAM